MFRSVHGQAIFFLIEPEFWARTKYGYAIHTSERDEFNKFNIRIEVEISTWDSHIFI